jgi:hypothetical protein
MLTLHDFMNWTFLQHRKHEWIVASNAPILDPIDSIHRCLLVTLFMQYSLLTAAVYLALSSCLGDGFRSRFSVNPRNATFDRHYFRTMTNSGPGLSEQIEMENIFKADPDLEESDEDL